MSNIVIENSDKVPNVDALEAVVKFIWRNHNEGKLSAYKYSMPITTERGYQVTVTEERSFDDESIACDARFSVEPVEDNQQ